MTLEQLGYMSWNAIKEWEMAKHHPLERKAKYVTIEREGQWPASSTPEKALGISVHHSLDAESIPWHWNNNNKSWNIVSRSDYHIFTRMHSNWKRFWEQLWRCWGIENAWPYEERTKGLEIFSLCKTICERTWTFITLCGDPSYHQKLFCHCLTAPQYAIP